MTNKSVNISVQQLKRAIVVREQIEQLEQELSDILTDTHSSAAPAAKSAVSGKRTMSAAARAKIGAAQRARWSKQKKSAPATATAAKVSTKGRRKMSAASRAKIAAAARARWATAKAANRKSLARA